MGLPMRLAPFTGVWGLSFVFAAMGTALALVWLRRPRLELAPAAIVLVVFALPALPPPQRGEATAVLVQPNISQTADWTPEWIDRQHGRLLSLSGQGKPTLIVWPEVPAPLYYATDAKLREAVDGLAAATGAHVILNTVPRREDGMPLNSALIVAPGRGAAGRYDKMNLVPFGEFVPWPFKAFLNKISTEAGDFAAGETQVLLPAGGHRIGAFVCYESVFAGFVRRFAAEGAELFVNISNDGWYGATAARDQHLAIARMRAAENRRWILRATNDGITSTIDPAGRAHRHLPSFVAGAAETRFAWIPYVTFYSRYGDWFVWVCALGVLAGYPWRITRTSPSRTT
jgi:apolipoprotein N-acyltransferase